VGGQCPALLQAVVGVQRLDFQAQAMTGLADPDGALAGNGADNDLAFWRGEATSVGDGAADQGELVSLVHGEVARIDDGAGPIHRESEGGGVADQGLVVIGAEGVEALGVVELDGIGGGGDEVGGNVELGIGAEDNASGVHQVEIGGPARDLDQAVNQGGFAANDAGEDVADLAVGEEGGDFTSTEAEFLETVEEVGSVLGELAAVDDEALSLTVDDGHGAIGGSGDGGVGEE